MVNASKLLAAAGAAAGRSGSVPALLSRVFHAAVASRSLAPLAISCANIATSASASAPTSTAASAPVSSNSVSSHGEAAGAANAGMSRSGSSRNLSTAAVAVQYDDDDDEAEGEYAGEKQQQGYPSPFRRAQQWQQQQLQWQQQKHAFQEQPGVPLSSHPQNPRDDETALVSPSSSSSSSSFPSSPSSSTPAASSIGCSSTAEPFLTMPYPSWKSPHSSHASRWTQGGDGSSDSGVEHRALLVDAAGTLVEPSEPVTKVYASVGRKYGVSYSEDEILQRYRHAYVQPWRKSILRYEDDARPFWQYVVSESTGCSHPDYLEELYQYYTTKEAWRLTDPHAKEAFCAIRDAGVKIAVVSNFDTRLRTVLKELDCHDWFDAIAVSAEVQAEKPNPVIFHSACDLVGVDPHHAVHVGDDRRNDLWGARDAGCSAWLWQDDVHSFHDVARKLGVLFPGEEESPEVTNKRAMRRTPRWADRPMIAANGLQFRRH
ncbi:hypothetical protein CLOM_g21889 [Closterium sp. NIES-68]|nr:hypothetical protein CLOM_g21889 [Closterium sp. NIES-68]GJP69700.1 hypothetical protein CLOP_g685 [Closterium sp. NIES-67]